MKHSNYVDRNDIYQIENDSQLNLYKSSYLSIEDFGQNI